MRRCCLLLVCLLLLTGCGRADTQDVSSFAPAEGDRLVIFTSHKETIYEPILKEFEQRTGIWVELETGGTVTLLERIAAGESGADLMFGGGADSLSAYSACFAPYVSEYAGDVAPEYDLGGGIWTPFSALPVVLIYNTKLVRQNPPERWADLLDAGWRGRIAFADPTVSGSSCTALGTLLQAVGGNTDNTLAAFFRNLDGRIIADSGGVVPDVADGSCYVGVTLEENARKAIADGLDVAIVYPAEGTSGRRGHRPRLRARGKRAEIHRLSALARCSAAAGHGAQPPQRAHGYRLRRAARADRPPLRSAPRG